VFVQNVQQMMNIFWIMNITVDGTI
jgi:hypothetical protein